VKAALSITGLLLTATLFAGPPDAADEPSRPNRLPPAPLFLAVFRAPDEPIVSEPIELGSAAERGFLYRPKSNERLPGLLLIANPVNAAFFHQTARELASIGYAVLIVPVAKGDSTALARAAARRLKSRKGVLPEQIGMLGWGPLATIALQAAAAESAQAAVLVDFDFPLAVDDRALAGLHSTAVLLVQAAPGTRDRLRRFVASAVEPHELQLPGARSGFMDGRSGAAFNPKAADRAWFEIYEFLGKHVEDAVPKPSLARRKASVDKSATHFVSIRDAMREANGPAGARTEVARALLDGPKDERDWKLLRERSRVLANCGAWLVDQTPHKGSAESWRRYAVSYRDAANGLADAAERGSLTEAQSALGRLNSSCARCHAEHR
jgi:hypothetical protein